MRGTVPPHLQSRFGYLDTLLAGDPPHPWRAVGIKHVGGVWHVGFAEDDELLLLVSVSGRGVVDCKTGVMVARDDDEREGVAFGTLKAKGTGPLEGQIIGISGIHGGGLLRITSDGWSVELHPLSWPDEEIFCARRTSRCCVTTPAGLQIFPNFLPWDRPSSHSDSHRRVEH